MNLKEFLQNQERIYNTLRNTSSLETDGLKPQVPIKQGGYHIIYRYSRSVTDTLRDFSSQVSGVIPSIVYGGSNAHTTISHYGIREGFVPDRDILNNLARAVHSILPLGEGVEIDHREWLINQTCIISAGTPNNVFLEDSKKIVENAHKQGFKIQMPWGAHITASRFMEEGSPAQVKELMRIAKEYDPIRKAKPCHIDVASFTFTPECLDIELYERFDLSNE